MREYNTIKVQDVNGNGENNEDDLSYSPPESLPVIIVDLQRLVGYKPSTIESAHVLKKQVQAALWGKDPEEASQMNKHEDGDVDDDDDAKLLSSVSRSFEVRVGELLESGIAQHSDTLQQDQKEQQQQEGACQDPHENDGVGLRYAVIDYPQYTCWNTAITRNSDGSIDEDGKYNEVQLKSTSRVWKRLLHHKQGKQHQAPVVNRLLQLLVDCNRPLLWKDAMLTELLVLASSEETAKVQKQHEKELHEWRTKGRPEKLEQLYAARDSLLAAVEDAQTRHRTLEKERDEEVALKLKKLCSAAVHNTEASVPTDKEENLLDAFDFEGGDSSFPTGIGNILGLQDDDNDEDSYYSDGQEPLWEEDAREYDEHGESLHSADDNHAEADNPQVDRQDQVSAPVAHPLIDGETSREGKLITKEQCETLSEPPVSEEERLRELCTKPALLKAAAVMNSLQERLQQVDDLLESIQEETWADEEAQEQHDSNDVDTNAIACHDEKNTQDITLLDQILAMILGSIPPPDQDSKESVKEHVKYLQQVHQSIICDWKAYFGRLPPALLTPSSSTELISGQDSLSSPQKQNVTTPSAAPATVDTCQSSQKRREDMRQSLGIVDNVAKDWEDDSSVDADNGSKVTGNDDNEEISPLFAVASTSPKKLSTANNASSQAKPTRVGLRPGGRLQR